jgi:hypothetical protein
MLRPPANWILLLFFLLITIPSTRATEHESAADVDLTNALALQEATRVLAEEVKLAARSQTYVIVDLVDRAVLIKGRGVELHRFPIEQWSGVQLAEASLTFRLQSRPPVLRRRIEPATGTELPPISLDDMPTDFALRFSPSFSMTIHPPVSDDFWRWLQFNGREWWISLGNWAQTLATGKAPLPRPLLHLTLAAHHAQSLAWTVTEGMPFLVRRTSSPSN